MKAQRELARLLAQRNSTPSGISVPQLPYSSLDDGSINEYDQDGNLVSVIGKQFDGSHGAYPVTGPVPPRPTAPTAENGVSTTLSWDGLFVGEDGLPDILITAPMDWSRVEIHVSQTQGFTADTAETLVDTIETPRGGSRPALLGPGTWYAVLVARSLAGKRSEQSPEVSFEITPGLTEEDVQKLRDEFDESMVDLNKALTTSTEKQAALDSAVASLRGETLPALEADLAQAGSRLDAADGLLNVTFPKRIADAETAASGAQTRATAAEAAATKAAADLVTARTRADAAATAATNATAAAAAAEASSARATGAAGVAEAAADKARQDAAAALVQAQNAGGDISSAQAAAAAAQTAADTAKTQATAAGTAAAAADAKAAQAAADAAKAAADTLVAQQQATKSASEATTAKNSAATATQKATAAETAATTAKTRADTAAANATAASARAGEAASAAATAAIEAEAAEASATRATGAAGVAETAADKAAADARAALVQAQNAGGNVSTAQAAATAAQTAADTAKAQAATAGTAAAAADAKAAQAAADAAKAAADAVVAQQQATKSASEATTAKAQAAASATSSAAAETAAATAKTRADTAAASASAAATRATAAETSATRATGAAGAAETAADTAARQASAALAQAQSSGSNATAAQTAATAAQTAADTAKAQAATAGTAAAAADAAAAQAAANAAQAAADLIVARNAAADARGDADTALARADSALTQAGSAARVMYSIANPSGTAREGDTWRKIVSNTGDVIAEWRYTKVGTAAASWKPQKVTSDMVANLDVGKLSAGAASLTQAVIDKLVANLAQFVKADIGNLTVTGDSALNTVTAERIAANVASFLSVTTDQLTAGTAQLGEAVARKFAAETGAFMKLYANQVFIGEGGNLWHVTDLTDPGWASSSTITKHATGGKNGGSSLLIAGAASQQGSYFGISTAHRMKAPHLVPGSRYIFSAWVQAGATPIPVGGASLWMRLYPDTTGTTFAWASPSKVANTEVIPANTWRQITGTFLVPEGVNNIPVIGLFSEAVNTSTSRFSDVVIKEAITPSLIVDGFFQGLRVIGASVETNSAAFRGVKINDAGLFAYDVNGKETIRFDGQNSILTGATIRTAAAGARWQLSEMGLEAWNAAGERYLLGNADGLEMTGSISSKGRTAEAVSRPISIRITAIPRDSPYGITDIPGVIFDDGVSAGTLNRAPGIYSMDGNSITISGRDSFSDEGTFELSSQLARVHAQQVDVGMLGLWPTQVLNLMGKKINIGANNFMEKATIDIKGDVTVNGQPLRPQYVPSTQISMLNGFQHHTGSGWTGVRYTVSGDIVEVTGAFTKASYANGNIIGRIPEEFRPAAAKKGINADITAAGDVVLTVGGGGAQSLSITFIR